MSEMSDSTICDIESISYNGMSVTTTSPTHESMPHILCEVERHLSGSTNHMSESILEGVSEPQHLASEIVDTACEATLISNDLTSTPSVFSSLVLGLLHDDMPILDESIPLLETTMAMVDNDASPTWFDRGKGVPSFDEMMDIALVAVDSDDPTTNVRGRRALAIAKPTPRGY